MLTWRPRERTTRIILASSNTPPGTPSVARHLAVEGRRRGLLEAGCHFVIERDGTAIPCRPHDVHGSHTRLANHDSIAIYLAGGWEGKDDHTPDQRQALHALLAHLWAAYGPLPVVGQNAIHRKPGSPRSPAWDGPLPQPEDDHDMAKKTKPIPVDAKPSEVFENPVEAAIIGKLTPQQQLVVNYLRAGHTLTPLIALTNLGIGSITSRVAELKKAGYPIEATPDQDFHGGRYMKYTWKRDQHGRPDPLPELAPAPPQG